MTNSLDIILHTLARMPTRLQFHAAVMLPSSLKASLVRHDASLSWRGALVLDVCGCLQSFADMLESLPDCMHWSSKLEKAHYVRVGFRNMSMVLRGNWQHTSHPSESCWLSLVLQ